MKILNWMKKITSAIIAAGMVMAVGTAVFAANGDTAVIDTAVIDTARIGSLTIYKYDETAYEGRGGAESFVASGEIGADAEDSCGNYAIQGVEFTYLKIADIATHSVTDAATGEAAVKVIYGLDNDCDSVFQTLGLDAAEAVKIGNGLTWYISDSLINALAKANQNQAVAAKNTLENFVRSHSGIAMPETDAAGKTGVSDLPVGLYLVVETAVPESVTVTTAPFLVSLPMTDLEGEGWIYDVTVYPKNLTGKPNLKKEVAEVTSGADPLVYGTAVSASMGDTLAYQVTSVLPMISSEATYLSAYTFADTMDKGLSYNQLDPVTLTWRDANGNVAAVWQKTDGKFTVSYGTDEEGNPIMMIMMTEAGLGEINPAYSQYTVVIDYTATLNQDETVLLGDGGNGNEVVLQWKRSNVDYYDILTAGAEYGPSPDDPDSGDHTHSPAVYTFGLEIQKVFSDGGGNAARVGFRIQNETDGYYLAAREAEAGLYYVTGQAGQDEENATVFTPASNGSLKIYGVEADSYVVTELETDGGYTLLKDSVKIAITANYTTVPRATEGCSHEEHKFISASATVNGNAVTMRGRNAIVPLTVINERGYEVPLTGDSGTFMLPLIGLAGAAGLAILAIANRRKRTRE